jgi:hypothetical protein
MPHSKAQGKFFSGNEMNHCKLIYSKIFLLLSSQIPEQPFVFIVRANPEPIKCSFVFASQSAITRPDAGAPIISLLLKLKRAVPWILLPEFVGFARRNLRSRRQRAVVAPEITRR